MEKDATSKCWTTLLRDIRHIDLFMGSRELGAEDDSDLDRFVEVKHGCRPLPASATCDASLVR